jgi:hypothetical protein
LGKLGSLTSLSLSLSLEWKRNMVRATGGPHAKR